MKKRVHKKGAIELSMTTIVVIIIAIVLLSLGLVFVRGIFGKLNDLTKISFEEADRTVREQMVSSNLNFFILGANTEMQVRSTQTMYVGVRNAEGVTQNFKLSVESADGKSNPTWVEPPVIAVPVRAGETKTIPIVVNMPGEAVAGQTYLYLIKAIKADNSVYDSDFLTVTVK